jgi:hypothetical protein
MLDAPPPPPPPPPPVVVVSVYLPVEEMEFAVAVNVTSPEPACADVVRLSVTLVLLLPATVTGEGFVQPLATTDGQAPTVRLNVVEAAPLFVMVYVRDVAELVFAFAVPLVGVTCTPTADTVRAV